GPAKCGTCHVPPLFTESGNNLHAPAEIGVDSFQADRSPTRMYRTAPLAGLWAHQKGGFYHDGRFATLLDVVNHYDANFKLNLSNADKNDLVESLKGICPAAAAEPDTADRNTIRRWRSPRRHRRSLGRLSA